MPASESVMRASVPLSVLLDAPELEAALLSPFPSAMAADPVLAERVRSAPLAASIVIELPEPAQYTQPDELLLITGLGLPRDPTQLRDYVHALSTTGVTALVFGLEPVYSQVPAALVEACREFNFPLVSLPPNVHFAAVTRRLNTALETERTRALRAMTTLAQRLTEAALQHRPVQQILSALARRDDSWAIMQWGDEVHSSGREPEGLNVEELLAELGAKLDAQPTRRGGGTPTAFALAVANGRSYEVAAHRSSLIRTRAGSAEPQALIAFGRSPRLTNSDRTGLLLASNIMELVVQLPAEQSMSVDQLLMHLLVESSRTRSTSIENPRFSRLLANSFGGAKTAHAVIAMRDPAHAPATAITGVPAENTMPSDANWLRRLLHTPFVEHRSRRLRAYVASPPRPSEFAQATALGWIFSVSSAHPFVDLYEAMFEAEDLARAAVHLGRHVNAADPDRDDEVWPASAALDASLAHPAATHWLTAISGEEHAELREVLSAWLRHHGSWDRTSRQLGLHRNTVRRLVAEAQTLLGRDLNDPIERARILLALTIAEPAE